MISDKDKLEALIGRAIEQGWTLDGFNIIDVRITYENGKLPIYLETDEIYSYIDEDGVTHEENNGHGMGIESVIFNHGFAQALWSEDIYVEQENRWFDTHSKRSDFNLHLFQYQMQQAVISQYPITYLYQAVFGEEK